MSGSLGLVRMGVRLYDPKLGRFLEVDPVEGGSANDYDYCSGDPVNCFDLGGTLQRDERSSAQHNALLYLSKHPEVVAYLKAVQRAKEAAIACYIASCGGKSTTTGNVISKVASGLNTVANVVTSYPPVHNAANATGAVASRSSNIVSGAAGCATAAPGGATAGFYAGSAFGPEAGLADGLAAAGGTCLVSFWYGYNGPTYPSVP
ncbi:MAG: repeat protein [Frankiales bacterium]|nr:repeat protein [Frankiales bacterium]